MFRSLQRPQSLVDAKVFVVLLHIERVTFGVGGEDFARAHAGLDGLFDAFKHARRYARAHGRSDGQTRADRRAGVLLFTADIRHTQQQRCARHAGSSARAGLYVSLSLGRLF